MNKIFLHLASGQICELIMSYVKQHKLWIRFKVYDDIGCRIPSEQKFKRSVRRYGKKWLTVGRQASRVQRQ